MPGRDELLEEWRQDALAIEQKMKAVEGLGSGPPAACEEITTAELCQEFSAWADELTIWLFELWDRLYGTDPNVPDPPPKPPFKN